MSAEKILFPLSNKSARELKMSFLKKILGICKTDFPLNTDCWKKENNKIIIDLSKASELEKPETAIRIEGRGIKKRILLIKDENNIFHAFENKCTHMGRRLDPEKGGKSLKCCSVFGSAFDIDGRPESGAAKKPVKKFKIVQKKMTLEINL